MSKSDEDKLPSRIPTLDDASVETSSPSASLAVAAVLAGLAAAGLVGLALSEWATLYPAGRSAAVGAGTVALCGLVIAAFGARKGQRLRGVAFLAGLLNLGVLLLAAVLGVGSHHPESFLPRALGEAGDVVNAQALYRAANHGFCDSRLECLMRPAECIPGYPADGPAFLQADALSTPRSWYTFAFRPGPAPTSLPEGASPTSIVSFSYAFAPTDPSSYAKGSGCGDSTGLLCVGKDDVMPGVAPDGTCVIEECNLERSGWR
jgi:hypothetical protein